MDAERITELLRMHGNRITWQSHLAFVDELVGWEPEEILDYHESLIDHLARGAWVGTSQNRVVRGGALGDMSADAIADHLAMYETLEGVEGVPEEVATLWRESRESLQGWRPDPVVDVTVPPGLIGVPFHPWTMDPTMMRHHEDPVRERALLLKYMNNPDLVSGGTMNELRLVLRAAPWAYFRRTGQRLAGVEPCHAEELERTGRIRRYTTAVMLGRGGDSVEYLAYTPAASKDAATIDNGGSFRAFAKLLGASIMRIESRAIDDADVEDQRWFVADAQLISDRLTEPETAQPNALSVALQALLFTTVTDRKQHPRLAEDQFWKLIMLLDDELSEESFDRLTAALAKKPLKAIIGFHETLTDVLYRLDRPELTKPPGSTEPTLMSVDVFLYFRCEVVARGLEAVASVLAAGGIVEEDWPGGMGESLLSVAPNAFELKTGEPFDHETEFSYESGSNAEAWGGAPAPAGELPAVAFGVRSRSADADGNGRERVRFWETASREEALERHDAAERELWGENYLGVLDAVALPPREALSVTKALGRVSYYRPI